MNEGTLSFSASDRRSATAIHRRVRKSLEINNEVDGGNFMTTPDIFLSLHYPEIKDLTVTFLTLTSSIFTFSVVFAEKLVPSQPKKHRGYLALYASWAFFIITLILVGYGLLRLFIAADLAKGGDLINGDLFFVSNTIFSSYVLSVYSQLFTAGVCFVGGLISLAVSAFYKLLKLL